MTDKLIVSRSELELLIDNFLKENHQRYLVSKESYDEGCVDAIGILSTRVSRLLDNTEKSQAEPVAKVIHTIGTGLLEGKTITKVMLDLKYVDLPAGTQLYILKSERP